MASYNYKGYEISIEQDPAEEGFRGSITKDKVHYTVFKPVIKVKHKQHVNNGSFFFPKWEVEGWDERLYTETCYKLKEELETIVNGIESFMVVERNKITKEFQEREDLYRSSWIEIRDYREGK